MKLYSACIAGLIIVTACGGGCTSVIPGATDTLTLRCSWNGIVLTNTGGAQCEFWEPLSQEPIDPASGVKRRYHTACDAEAVSLLWRRVEALRYTVSDPCSDRQDRVSIELCRDGRAIAELCASVLMIETDYLWEALYHECNRLANRDLAEGLFYRERAARSASRGDWRAALDDYKNAADTLVSWRRRVKSEARARYIDDADVFIQSLAASSGLNEIEEELTEWKNAVDELLSGQVRVTRVSGTNRSVSLVHPDWEYLLHRQREAIILAMCDKWDESESLLRACMQESDEWAVRFPGAAEYRLGAIWCRYNHALCLERLGQKDAASREQDRVRRELDELTSTTADVAVQLELAWLLSLASDNLIQRPRQAVDIARRASEKMPGNAVAWLILGVAQYYAGAFEEAASAIERAEDMNCQELRFVQFVHAIALQRAGQREQARVAYDLALAEMEEGLATIAEQMYWQRFGALAGQILGIESRETVSTVLIPPLPVFRGVEW